MNKGIKLVFNILIVVAAVVFIGCFAVMMDSFDYRREQDSKGPKEVESSKGVFDYRLKHKAYGEVTNKYFTDRMYSMEAPEGLEMTYLVSEYANTAFLRCVYEEKKDGEKERACREKLSGIRAKLGDYVTAADEIDEILK